MTEYVLNAISLLGTGGLIAILVQHFLSRRLKEDEYRKTECKEAFAGFLSAFSKYDKDVTSEENKANMELWAARVQLVSSRSVYEQIDQLLESKPETATRPMILQLLIIEMRHDLGIGK